MASGEAKLVRDEAKKSRARGLSPSAAQVSNDLEKDSQCKLQSPLRIVGQRVDALAKVRRAYVGNWVAEVRRVGQIVGFGPELDFDVPKTLATRRVFL